MIRDYILIISYLAGLIAAATFAVFVGWPWALLSPVVGIGTVLVSSELLLMTMHYTIVTRRERCK